MAKKVTFKLKSVNNRIEYSIVLLFSAVCFIFLLKHSGGPISWDELLYMNISITSIKAPFVLNRYFHIYLQKLFFWIFGEPLLGAKVFWSFIISFCMFLIYLNSKLISKSGSFFVPCIAIVFFFSHDLVFCYSGVTYVDFTLMLMMLVCFSIYTIYTHHNLAHKWLLLITYGFSLFMAIKSKEPGLCLFFLVPGFLKDNGQWKTFLNIMKANWYKSCTTERIPGVIRPLRHNLSDRTIE